MGGVADHAPFEFHRGMLENPGPSFFGMALKTDIDVEFVPPLQAGPVAGAVGGVAVGAAHGAFKNLVPRRKPEFRFDFGVAGKAQAGLFLLEKLAGWARAVDAMAVAAGDTPESVGAPLELEKGFPLVVALETSLCAVGGVPLIERIDKFLFPAGVDMFSSRSMTGFAALTIRRGSEIEKAFPVRVFSLKGKVDFRMADPARIGDRCLHVAIFGGSRRSDRGETYQTRQNRQP